VGIAFILYLLVLFFFLLGYIIYLIKKVVVKFQACAIRDVELMNHIQNDAKIDDDDDDDDDNMID